MFLHQTATEKLSHKTRLMLTKGFLMCLWNVRVYVLANSTPFCFFNSYRWNDIGNIAHNKSSIVLELINKEENVLFHTVRKRSNQCYQESAYIKHKYIYKKKSSLIPLQSYWSIICWEVCKKNNNKKQVCYHTHTETQGRVQCCTALLQIALHLTEPRPM